MALNLYKPEWQSATPTTFKSRNPLIKEDVILDVYDVEVEEKDALGNVCGTHTESCVTHQSLLNFYQQHLLPIGMSVKFDVPQIGTPGLIVVKCVLEKNGVTKEQWKLLNSQGIDVNDDIVYHVEAIGEASVDNCKTEISLTHLTNTAENRAFDRALVRFLALDLDRPIYSSSDELGRPVQGKEPAESVEGQDQDWFSSGKSSAQSMTVEVNRKPDPQPVPESTPAKPAVQATVTAPVQVQPEVKPASTYVKPAPAVVREPTPTEKEIAQCARQTYSDEEYAWMLAQQYQFSKSEYNGKTFAEMIGIIKEGKAEAKEVCVAFYSLLRFKPKHADQVSAWQRFISYMAKEKLLIVYPSGKVFVGKKGV